MANKPQDINPFAQFVEQPKQEPNPFEKFANPEAEVNQDYGIVTKALDLGKMVASGLTSGTLNIPQGLESSVRNVPRQALEQQQIETKPVTGLTFAEELVKKGPAQLFSNIGRSLLKSTTGQSLEEQQKKQKEDQVVLDRAISKLPHIPGVQQLAETGEKTSKAITESISPAGKAALENSQIQGNILKSIQTGSVDNLSFGKDPSVMGYALQGSQVLGSLAPVIATALMTKNTRFAGVGPGAVGFGQGAGEAVDTAKQHVASMSDAQLAEASPYFKHMVENGVDPVEARKVVTDKAAEYAAQLQGSVAAFGGDLTAKLVTGKFDKLLTTAVKNKLSQIALGGTAGLTEEGLQEFLEGVAADLGINKTVAREIGADSFANFVMGAVGGVVPGAYRGAVAKREEAPAAPGEPTAAPTSVAGAPAKISETDVEGGEPPAPPVAPPPAPAAAPTDIAGVQPSVTPVTVEPPVAPPVTPPASLPVTPQPPVIQQMPADQKAALDELQREFDDLNAKLSAGQVSADQFTDVNNRLADIQTAMSEIQAGKPVEAAAPAAPEIKTPKIKPAPEIKAPAAPVEEVVKAKAPEEEERVLTPEELEKKYAGASKQVERIKELSNIGDEDRTDEENDFLSVAHRELYKTAEKISAPPRKKGYASHNHIDVNQFGDKWVAGSSYMGSTGGYGVGVSYDSTPYNTREEAINAEIDKMRSYAQAQKDSATLKWLDSIDTRKPKVLTKEEKAAENRKRQEEKRIAAQQTAEEESEAEAEDESDSYQLEKDKQAEKIVSPDGRLQLFLREITDKDPQGFYGEKLTGQWVVDKIYKTPSGASYGPGKTPKNTPISFKSKAEALKHIIDSVQSRVEDEAKRLKKPVDEATLKFLDKVAAENNVTIEPKKAAPTKEEKAEANRKRQEEKKAKAAAEKEAAKKTEKEELDRELEQRRSRQAAEAEKLAEKQKREKEIEEMSRTELADDEGIPGYQLKDVRDAVTKAEKNLRGDIQVYLRMGEDKADMMESLAKYNNAVKKFNETVAEIRGEEATEKAPKAEVKEEPKAEEKHIEGKTSEPVTAKTIEEAIDKAETKVSKTQIKRSINEQFDKAIKEAKYPDNAAWKKSKATEDQFVTIDIPGDGKFRVKNNVERLKELQKRLLAALPLKGGKPSRKPSAASVTAPEKVLADMINDGEMDNALEYAKINKIVPTYAGLTEKGRNNLDKMYGDERQKLTIQAEIEGRPTDKIETYQESMDRITAKMKEEGRESEYEKAAKALAETKAKIAELQAQAPTETILTPPQQKILEKEVDKLSDDEIATLEQHYGVDNYSLTFLKRVREDAVKYINDGANAVDKAVRSIISKIAAAILSVAIVFNPNYMSDASAVALPQVVTKTVKAEVPTDAKGMSESGQKAYATLYPALKQELQKNNKYFTVVDKPTSKVYVFNPDGSLMTQSTVVLGKAFGDTYVGKTDFTQNRITPAGLFKPKAEKGSATYDGKTVYTLGNVQEGWNAVFMHTVYLKESDAKARLQALETGEGTRLSHGCINGPTALMEKIDNKSMDESHVFIVPDNQAATDDYIANRVSNEDLTRETVTPVTEKMPAPKTTEKGQQELIAREEEAERPPKSQAEINKERQQAKREAMLKAESPYYGSFTNNIDEESIGKTREQIKKEKSESSSKVKHSLTKILRTLAKGEAGIKTQRDATEMLEARTELNREKKYARTRMDSAAWFANQAEKDAELHKAYPNDTRYGLDPEVAAVIRDVANKYPKLLEGLKLSIKQPGERGSSGNFNPFIRLVTLFKDTSGTSNPKTFRHEIMHSIEQMMPDDVYQMVIDNWALSLGKAIAKHTDGPHKAYFEAVLNYVENPTEENKAKAERLMPSYDMYQYMNPSEFWAVNAEKLFAARLGGRWENFKRAISKLFEGLKSVFGFDNRYGVHKAFDRLFKGPMERGENRRMLVDYIMRNNPKAKYEFLSNFEEYDNRREEDGRSEAVIKTSPSLLDRMLGGFKGAQRTWKHVIANPTIPTSNMGGKLARALTYIRVKNVWYAKGLEVMEAKLYGGKLRDGMNKAIASVAVTNALHAGHIGSEVILRGKLIYNTASQMFQAVRDKYSMANVMMAKHDLIERVGLQRANNMIQDYFEAKRSRSIIDEYLQREGDLAALEAEYESTTDDEKRSKLRKEIVEAEKDLKAIDVARKKVNMDDDQIDFYSALEDENPELRTMMDNWTAVNHNMIDNMEMSNLISKKRAAQLRSIKDYVPWYRIKDNMEEVHSPAGAVRSLTNVAQEKKFGDYETDLDIDDIVDNMLHNVMVLTRNSIRNHAANQVAMAYATRNENGKIVRFGEEGIGPNGEVRTNVVINGKRTIIEIKDPLVAQSVLGMESVAIPGLEIFGMIANNLRRGVTLWPQFQLKQLFMDAPTAALVSGVKSPHAVYADTFRSFIKALNSNDPIVDMLKSYGIGGYQSVHRAPEQMYKQKIGLLEQNKLDKVLDVLDRVSDSSDYAQRIAIYNRVMKETDGDQLQAIMQANNVIDFMKHGSGSIAQFLSRTVSFMNAYAQQIDVLAESLAGGGLKGKSRRAALAQLAKTGGLLAFYSMMYCWAVGDDDEYQKLDDQTKLRNFFISKKITGFKEDLLIPMSTSASFFFKSIPELTYNTIITKGTKNEHDAARVRKALGKAAIDSLLGPNPIPTGVKPVAEIALNHNFLTGGTVVPRGLEGLESAEQYNATTSELGKVISATTFGALNPIEADYLVRGLFGTTGSMLMYGSNLFNGDRATPQARDNPLYGGLVAPDVARGREDLFYDLRDRAEEKDKTFNKLHERGRHEEADKYLAKNRQLIEAAGYTTEVGNALKEINKEIRRLGESTETGMTADQRRERIKDLQLEKVRILDEISVYRKEYGL